MSSPTGSPIVEMSRTDTFSAAHRLHSPQLSDEENLDTFGKCNNPNGHGHNYKVTVTCRGPVDPRTGMTINLTEVKQVMKTVLDELDHKNLDRDVAHFRDGVVSTTENVTVYIWQRIIEELPFTKMTLLKSVTVHETDKNVFTFSGEYS